MNRRSWWLVGLASVVVTILLVLVVGIGIGYVVYRELDQATVFEQRRDHHDDLPILDRYEEVPGSEERLGDGDCSWGPSCDSPPATVAVTYTPTSGTDRLACDELETRLVEWSAPEEVEREPTAPCDLSGLVPDEEYVPWHVAEGADGTLVVTIGDR